MEGCTETRPFGPSNRGYPLDECRKHSDGVSWSRQCFSGSPGRLPSPDQTSVMPYVREIGPSVFWRFLPGFSHLCSQ